MIGTCVSMCFYLTQGGPSHEASLTCCFLPPARVWVTCRLLPGSASRCSCCCRRCCFGSDTFPPDTWRNAGSDLPWALPLPRADCTGLARKSGRWCLRHQLGCLVTRTQERSRDLPGGPVAKTPHPQCKGPGFNPRSGN